MPSERCAAAAEFASTSIPIILVQVTQQIVMTLTVMHIGRQHGAIALAGASLGLLTFNVTSLMLAVAPLQALDTVAPQAFGAGRMAEVGLACQRAFVCSLLAATPLAAVLVASAEPLLIALGQDAHVAAIAGEFLRRVLFSIPIQAAFETMRRGSSTHNGCAFTRCWRVSGRRRPTGVGPQPPGI